MLPVLTGLASRTISATLTDATSVRKIDQPWRRLEISSPSTTRKITKKAKGSRTGRRTNEETNPAGDEVAFRHSGRSHMHRLHGPNVQSCGFGPSAEPRGISEVFAVAVRCALPGDT